MMFVKKSPNSHGFVNPRDIEEMWRDQFDWVYREYDYAVINDKKERAEREVQSIVLAGRCRVARREDQVAEILKSFGG